MPASLKSSQLFRSTYAYKVSKWRRGWRYARFVISGHLTDHFTSAEEIIDMHNKVFILMIQPLTLSFQKSCSAYSEAHAYYHPQSFITHSRALLMNRGLIFARSGPSIFKRWTWLHEFGIIGQIWLNIDFSTLPDFTWIILVICKGTLSCCSSTCFRLGDAE